MAKGKRGRGQTLKLIKQPEIMDRVTKLIAGGLFARTACANVGIDEGTFYEWMRRGEGTDSGRYEGKAPPRVLVEFAKAVRKAEADRESILLSKIVKAGTDPKHWTANAWMLERTNPAQYSPRVRHFVELELSAALGRLREEFRNEPETFERVLSCLAGVARDGRASGDEAFGGAVEAPRLVDVDPSSSLAGSVGVSGA